MEQYFELAGCRVRVTGPDADMFTDPTVLAAFAAPPGNWSWSIDLKIVDRLDAPHGTLICDNPDRQVYAAGEDTIAYTGGLANGLHGANMRILRRGRESWVQVRREYLRDRIGAKLVLSALEVEHMIVEENGFLLHCSCIDWQGKAILFTAPSGIGKSTQADLWRRHRGAEIINGDRIAVMLREGGYDAVGIPFSGSSGISLNRQLSVAAIVCLSQAGETTIESLSGLRAFRQIWEGCSLHTWNRQDVCRCLSTVTDAVAKIPVFHLACTPDESAVKAVESVLRK